MSEVVFRDDFGLNDQLDLDAIGKQSVRRSVNVWASDRKVTYTLSTYYTMMNRRKQRIWRWKTDSSSGFYKAADGSPIPFSYVNTPSKGWFNGSPVNIIDLIDSDASASGTPEAKAAFRLFLSNNLGVSGFSDVYPMAGRFGINVYTGMVPSVRRAFRAKTDEDFVYRLFGKSRVCPDFINKVLSADPDMLAVAQTHRSVATDAQLLKILSSHNNMDWEPWSDYRFFTDRYATFIRKFLSEIESNYANTLADSAWTAENAYRLLLARVRPDPRGNFHISKSRFDKPVDGWNQLLGGS